MDPLPQILARLDQIDSRLKTGFSPVLNVKTAAEYLACSPRTVNRLILTGRLSAVRRFGLGIRIRRRDLEAYIEFGIPFRKLTTRQREAINV